MHCRSFLLRMLHAFRSAILLKETPMGVSTALFQNLKKCALILGKNVLTRFIGSSMGLISHFKFCFKRIQEKNLRNLSLGGPSFVCCRLNVHRSALFSETCLALKNSWLHACNCKDESCHCVVRIGSPALISFYCVCFRFLLFLSFFIIFLWILLSAQVLR